MKQHIKSRSVFGLILALCIALLVGLTPGQAAAVTVPSSVRSGVSGNTGLDFIAWQQQIMGRQVTAAHIFAASNNSWNALVEPGYIAQNMGGLAKPQPGIDRVGYTGLLVISLAPWPTNYVDRTSEQHLQACANGNYNAQWQRFGRWAAGTGNQVVARVAWEANGNWYPWSAKFGLDNWKNCFIQVARAIKSTAQGRVLIDWSVNRGESTNHFPANPYKDMYPATDLDKDPSNDVIDIVSVNAYNQYPGAFDGPSWDRFANGPYGLSASAGFASFMSKKWAIAEWGVSRHGGGDVPFFIKAMATLINFVRPWYETYHEDPDPTNTYGTLRVPGVNPNSARTYRECYTTGC